MRRKKSYAVFGLGRYGMAVARELVENGMEVLAVDADQRIVNDAAAYLPICKCADVSETESLARLGIGIFDVAVICTASNFEASVMAVTLCKEAGVKKIVAKCASEMQQKILSRVGADEVVFPEHESGIQLAKNLLSSGFIDMLSLSREVSMVEIEVKPEWAGKTLIQLDLRKRFGINVVAVKQGEDVDVDIDPQRSLVPDMTLIVIANRGKLNNLR